MSQSLASYSRGYSTRSCRQQCFYGNGIAATENVLAAVSADGHEVARDFTLNNRENNSSRLRHYKQQLIGHTIPSVEDIEKWLRYTSEHISNPELNAKNNSQAGLERSLSEQLSEVFDKEPLTDIDLTPIKLNIDYDAVLTELQNNKILIANEKDDQLILPNLHLDDLIVPQEIPAIFSQSQCSNTDVNFQNLPDKSDKNLCNDVEKTVEIVQLQNGIETVKQNQELKNTETEVINNVNRDSFDAALTMSIQDLSIDSSDRSCDTTNCANFENKPDSSESENLNPLIVAQKKSARYNTRSKSTNSSIVNSKFQPSMIKRKRKVSNQENTVQIEKNNTVSSNTLLCEKPLNENGKTFISKSPRSSTSEFSGSESDDLCKARSVNSQELIIAKALKEVGITEDSLEFFYNSENIKTWRCHLKNCARHFAKLCYLKVHLLSHMNVKPFKCDYSGCSWAFYSEFKLKRHKETHLNKKDYICRVPGCERRFTTIYNLASHEKLHTRPNKIACHVSDCTAKFQTKRALESHMKCHDESLAPYACHYEACGKRFYSSNALMTHQRCHSYSEEDLTCSWPGCGKTFDQPCRKKAHMRSHTGQKPYSCTFKGCGWAFSTSSKLKRHQKKHTNDRKFVCDEESCTKAFMRSQHLKEHKLTHTEKRLWFHCHHCAAGFVVKSSLYAHMKNHTNKNYARKLQKKGTVKKKTRSMGNRVKKNSVGSSGSESTSSEETENISVVSNFANMPIANVLLHKMYKCPIESCSKWYSHRSSLRVHLRKHTSPLSEIQNDNEVILEDSTTSSPSNSKPNEGAARTEFTCEYVLSLKPDRQAVGLNEVGTVELSEGLLFNKALPSIYCQEDVGLSTYQILLLDTSFVDGMHVLE